VVLGKYAQLLLKFTVILDHFSSRINCYVRCEASGDVILLVVMHLITSCKLTSTCQKQPRVHVLVGYVCLFEGVHLRLATEGKVHLHIICFQIFIHASYISEYSFQKPLHAYC